MQEHKIDFTKGVSGYCDRWNWRIDLGEKRGDITRNKIRTWNFPEVVWCGAEVTQESQKDTMATEKMMNRKGSGGQKSKVSSQETEGDCEMQPKAEEKRSPSRNSSIQICHPEINDIVPETSKMLDGFALTRHCRFLIGSLGVF